jgi:pimeloyl-ACP methyl ester carboxylesterase
VVPPHFIVVVPGYMGSKLRDKNTGEIVWIDFSTVPKNPSHWDDWVDNLLDKMVYPNDDLEPAGIVDEVVIVSPWAKQEQYGRLIVALEEMGYRADPSRHSEEELNVYCFSYDWRQDNRISGRELGQAIERWSTFHPGAEAWLLGHSNGGIVSRWYIEKEGGQDKVGKLFLFGSPWDGAPKTVRMLVTGVETLFRKRFNPFNFSQRSRDLVRTFPSAYQLVPVQNPFLRDLDNQRVNPFEDTGWLSTPEQRRLLLEGKQFNEELGTTLSVKTFCIFGRQKPTQSSGLVRFAAGHEWVDIEWMETEAGDGTVPLWSAVHPEADEKLPFVVGHGDIYINPSVLQKLQWELLGQYELAERDAVTTDRLDIMFEPDRDAYQPGETIRLWATVHGNAPDAPAVSGAQVQVQLVWRQVLPGDEDIAPPQDLPGIQLWESGSTPGRYEGDLVAPETEGYYELRAAVAALGEPTVMLKELITVEALPDA